MSHSQENSARSEFLNASGQHKAPPKEIAEPYAFRLTPSEKARLIQLAGNKPVSVFIRERLFGDATQTRRKSQRPTENRIQLGKVLAELGRSELAKSLSQIARSARSGSLPVTDELSAEIEQACADVQIMRQALIEALGIKVQE